MKNVVVIAFILVLLSAGTNFLEAQQKSTALALGLSIGVPVVGCLTTAALEAWMPFMIILAIGPSAGHFYAEQWSTGFVFTGLRTATLGVSTILAISELLGTYGETGDPLFGFLRGADVFAVGFTVCCVIAVVDWAFVPSSVRKWNERLQFKPEIDLNKKRYGVGFVYRF